MRPDTRLILCVIVIVGSAFYATLIIQAPSFAQAIVLGYIALLLTILTATTLWKRP